MKRIISLILTFVLIAGIVIVPGVTASAAEIKTGTLVTFGSYPQTSVIDKDQLDLLNSQKLDWTYYDYYCDGKQENFMKYADVTLSGERYRAVTFTHYRPCSLDYPSDSDSTYQDDNGYEPNKIFWFRYDPIVWRVLDANEGLLMAENIIDSQPFHDVYYSKDGYWYGDQSYTHYTSDWAYSSLRKWMNDDFYNTAFSGTALTGEQSFITPVNLKTPSGYNSAYDATPTEKDSVFPLTSEDVLNEDYGFSSYSGSSSETNRIAYGTDYARCQGLYVDDSTGEYYSGASYWRLRTPNRYGSTGSVDLDGGVNIYYGGPDITFSGVRPALYVNLKSAISKSLIKVTDSNNLVINGPAGTEYHDEASDIKTGTLVTFGSYPQSRVTNKSELKKLNAKTLSWKYYDYYCGSKQENFMKYADVTYSGAKYRAVAFDHYRPYKWDQSGSSGNTLQDENGYEPDTVYWFKYEPIVWRVLDADAGLLMAENIIDSQPFHNRVFNNGYYYGDQDHKYYIFDWAYSSLRKWMNDDFYNTAFSSAALTSEQNFITPVDLNTPSSHSSEYDATPTKKDRVFPLTREDVLNEDYGFSSYSGSGAETNRIAYGTDYARCQGLGVDYSTGKYYSGASYWRLRTPGSNYYTDSVGIDGSVNNDYTYSTYLGIRPALYVDLKSAISQSLLKLADGSEIGEDPDPYVETKDDPDPVAVDFNIDGNTGKTTLQFKQAWFSQDSVNYNHELATFCSQIAMLGYEKAAEGKTKKETLSVPLMALGFDNINAEFSTGRDEVNYFIADKEITVNGENKLLVFTGFIGSYHLQWNSNFDPYGTQREYDDERTAPYGDKSEKGVTHLGFLDAKEFVREKLEAHIKGVKDKNPSIDDSNITLLITGHSRGAATANLLAADLIKGAEGDKGYEKFAEADNIFTYTFATPNVTKKEEKSNKHFERIFNVVNPEDFVTKMLPSGKNWGFGKYGTTYTLPSKTNDANYKKLLAAMQPYFKKFCSGLSYAPYPSGEKAVYDIVKDMTKSVKGVEKFDEEIRIQIGEPYTLSPFVFFQEGLCPMVNSVSDKVQATVFLLSILVTDLFDDSIYSKIIHYFIRDELIGLVADKTAVLKTGVSGIVNENLVTITKESSLVKEYFAHSHWVQTYCAYMCGLTEAQLTAAPDGRKAYKNTVNCPVDIEVYDNSTSELVGRIVNNEVDSEIAAKDNSVVMSVDGDEKIYWLPGNGDYNVKLLGNDNGTMDCSIVALDSEGEEIDRVNFFDVPLTNKTEYAVKYDHDVFTTQDMIINGQDSVIREPDMKFNSEDSPSYTVALNTEGDGLVYGNATVTAGDYTTVTASPNEGNEFVGWYENDKLITEETVYRFRPEKDINLVAKFKKSEEYVLGDIDGNGHILADDARLALRASAKLEELSEVQLLAADVDGNGQVLADDARQILRFSAKLQQAFDKAA